MEWELHEAAVQPRVLIMVSKAGHCLNDLLYRRAAESLRIDVPLVVGNHPDLAPLAARTAWPSSTCPACPNDPLSAQRAEGRLLDLVSELGIDFVVLARYMRLLSPGAVRQAARPDHQHPPLVPAQFQGGTALPPGPRARREADRRDRALRHRRPGRGPDHRAGSGPRRPHQQPRRTSPPSAATPSGSRWPARCAGTPSTASSCTGAAPSSSSSPGRRSRPVSLRSYLSTHRFMVTLSSRSLRQPGGGPGGAGAEYGRMRARPFAARPLSTDILRRKRCADGKPSCRRRLLCPMWPKLTRRRRSGNVPVLPRT